TCRTRITVALFAATHRCANGLQFDQVLWSRLANARHTNQCGSNLFGSVLFEQGCSHLRLVVDHCFVEDRACDQAFIVTRDNLVGKGSTAPLGGDPGVLQQSIGAATRARWYDEDADALAACTTGTARAVQQGVWIGRQI